MWSRIKDAGCDREVEDRSELVVDEIQIANDRGTGQFEQRPGLRAYNAIADDVPVLDRRGVAELSDQPSFVSGHGERLASDDHVAPSAWLARLQLTEDPGGTLRSDGVSGQ